MAHILVGLEPPALGEEVVRILTAAKHEATAINLAGVGLLNYEGFLEAIKSQAGDLVILNYFSTDGFSIKLMQMARDAQTSIRFIFILTEEVGSEHLIMAMNEGASALVSLPIKPERLINYTTRALAAQRAERTFLEEIQQCRRLLEKEKCCSLEMAVDVSSCKRQNQLYHQLINYLLAVSSGIRKKTRILLVSDSSYQLELFRKPLEELGFLVTTAKDGQTGLNKALEEQPRIIVSDLEMPEMNGIELCQAVKNDARLAPNHFIICTANKNRIDEVNRPENRVDDCLIKPSRPEEFQEFISRVALGILI